MYRVHIQPQKFLILLWEHGRLALSEYAVVVQKDRK